MRFTLFLFGFFLFPFPVFAQVPTLGVDLSETADFCLDGYESNLPILVIETLNQVPIENKVGIPPTEAVVKLVAPECGCRASHCDEPDAVFRTKFNVRGNASRRAPKLQYKMEIEQIEGAPEGTNKFPLLGLPEADEWVLSAAYVDLTLLRNPLAYALFRSMGHYSPRTKYFEMILNGEYRGVYTLIEKIERDKNRVDVPKFEETGGGFLMTIDDPDDDPSRVFRTSERTTLNFIYPKVSSLKSDRETQAVEGVKRFLADFEQAIFRDDGSFRSMLEENSAIDTYLLQELSNNMDGFRRSIFLYGETNASGSDGRVAFGPLWDFDIAFGNIAVNQSKEIDDWRINYEGYLASQTEALTWFGFMIRDRGFSKAISDRWWELRAGPLGWKEIEALIDGFASELQGGGQQRNFQKWKLFGNVLVSLRHMKPLPYPQNYEGEVAKLKQWMRRRIHWMDTHMIEFEKGQVATTNITGELRRLRLKKLKE